MLPHKQYIDREDLIKAYAAFREENPAAAPGQPPSTLRLVERAEAVYSPASGAPFVKPEDLKLDLGAEVVAQVLQRLRAYHGERAAATSPDRRDLGILAKITSEWMEKTMKEKDIAMPPRNVQSILFLAAAAWLREQPPGGARKALLGRMGTGEGKSLAFAMLAAHAVLAQGKKVHVLEYNEVLRNRDFADNKSFFDNMGITVSKDLSSGAAVVYCVRDDMESHYRLV